MSKEVVFVSAPLCPKCVRIKRWLKELSNTNPEINIIRINIATNAKKARKYNIKTIPTLIVGQEIFGGWVKEEEYRRALEKLLLS